MSTGQRSLGNVLLLGARGMLGQELARCLGERAESGAVVTCWDVDELDICNRDAVAEALRALRPSIVINAAAYTNVDGCESNVGDALAANGEAPGHLAHVCREIDALLVHFSTDFVFDGTSRRPYRPTDPPHPVSMYGRSKLQGEAEITAVGGQHLIVRTSWLFGPLGKNFVEAILARAEAGESLRVVDDQVGRPTLAGDLAAAVLRLIDCDARGVLHFANRGECSWHGFAERIVQLAGCDVPVAAIPSSALDRPAKRPAYSVLDTSDYERVTGETPSDWENALERYMQSRARATAL